MDSVYDYLDTFKKVLDLLENQFGMDCEFVLHDNTKEYEHTVVDIRNGHVSGRKVGDCGGSWGLELLRKTTEESHLYNKVIHTRDGKTIRGSSIIFRNDEGENIGSLCINQDITDTLKCEEYLRRLNNYSTPAQSNALFAQDVTQLMDNLLVQCENMFNKPTADLTKDEKLEIVRFLDQKGAFLITRSGDKVCEFLGISKFTLYNYLETIRNE